MENGRVKSDNHFFLYILLLSFIVVTALTYYRFIIKRDYIVGYNIPCDSSLEKCFVDFEGEMGSEFSFYSKMEKYAPDLFKECGSNITECNEANVCLQSDRGCKKKYCDINNNDGDTCVGPDIFNNNATGTKK